MGSRSALLGLALIVGAVYLGFRTGEWQRRDGPRQPVPIDAGSLERGATIARSTEAASPAGSASSAALELGDVIAMRPGFEQYRAAYSLVGDMGTEDLRAGIQAVLAVESDHVARAVGSVLVERLVALDARSAMDEFRSLVSEGDRRYLDLLSVLVRELGFADERLAERALAQVRRPEYRRRLTGYLARERLLAASALGRGGVALPEVRDGNFREAIERGLGNPDRRIRMKAVLLARQWASVSPDEAFAYAEALTEEDLKGAFLESVLSAWAARDFQAAIDAAVALGSTRNRYVNAVLMVRTDSNPEEAMRLAEDLDSRFWAPGSASLRHSVIARWAQHEPLAAATYLERTDGLSDATAVQQVLSSLARRDPWVAVDWVKSTGLDDPSTAHLIAGHLVRGDLDRVQRFVDSTTDGPLRGAVLQNLAGAKYRTDPLQAVEWLARYEGDEAFAGMASVILGGWAGSDPIGAADYASTIADDATRTDQLLGIVRHASLQNPEQAVELLDYFEASTHRDQALASVSANVARRDWVLGMELIDQIADAGLRKSARIGAIVRLGPREQGRVQTLLEEYGLEDDPQVARWYQAPQVGISRGLVVRPVISVEE